MKKYIRLYNITLKLSVISTAICSGILAVLLNDIIESYQLKGTQEGLMSSMISIGALTALITSILLQGYFRKPRWIVFSGLTAAIALILKGIPMPYFMFLIMCLIMGFGNGSADSYQSSFLADLNKEDTPRHMGAMHGIFGIGGVLTPFIFSKMLKYFYWRTVYIIAGIICLVFILQFAVISGYLEKRLSLVSKAEPKFSVRNFKELFFNRHFVMLLLCIFFSAAAQSGVTVWTIRYVSTYLKSSALSGICLSVYWIASTVSRFFSPLIPWKPCKIIAVGAFASAFAWAIALVVNVPVSIFIACIIVGLASGSGIPLSLSEGTSMYGGQTGFATSMLMFFKTVGQILSPIIIAYISYQCQMRVGMLATSVFFAINGLFAVLFLYGLKKQSNS